MSKALAVLGLLLLPALGVSLNAVGAQAGGKSVLWVEVSDYISPATHELVENAIQTASASEHSAVLLTLNTLGGLQDSTLKITESIIRSPLPVLGYVYPPGGQALSAGTYILMATDYAAMAPSTTIGSAQPVVGVTPVDEPKIINALVERMVSFAELRGRNATQAERFITNNDNLTPSKALERGVIEAVAVSPEELLSKAHGVAVRRVSGEEVLDLRGASLVRYTPSVRVSVIKILSEPLVSSLLMAVGFLALILGLTTPGHGGEAAGVIMIILGLIGQGFNPNLVAVALMAAGVGLIVFELYSPGFGAFGIGGIIVLGLGLSLMITVPPDPSRPPLVSQQFVQAFLASAASGIAVSGVFFGFLTYKVVEARRGKHLIKPYPMGEGRAVDDLSPDSLGYVVVEGEYWRAKSRQAIPAGGRVRVVGEERGVLLVEPAP